MIEADDVRAYPYVVGALVSVAGGLGHFREAHEMVDRLTEVLRRRGLPYACDTAKIGHYGTIYLLMDEGRLHEARALVLAEPDEFADEAMVVASAGAFAALGSSMQDAALIDMAERWLELAASPGGVATHSYGRGLVASFRGDAQRAAEHIRYLLSNDDYLRPMYVLNSRRFVQILLAAGCRPEAEAHVADGFARAAALDSPPLLMASLHLCRALLALDAGDDELLWRDAHRAVEISDEHGFALFRIDALEVLALAFARRDRPAVAARVFGCTTAERARIGYRQRVAVDIGAAEEVVARLAVDEHDATAAGAATPVREVVAYVRRMHGQRSRPTVGWASLTPTERHVAGLVAKGLANAQIATALLMSPATVKTHITRIFGKLGITNRTELAAMHAQRTADDDSADV